VIASKFPTYALKHENKALWLIHQHRTLYDLEDTEYDYWGGEPDTRCIREKIRELDNKFFQECKCLFTNGRTTANRMKRYNGFNGKPLFPPPKLADQIYCGEYGDRILYIGRLEPNKRPDLLIKAASKCKKAKITIIGKGRKEDHERLRLLIEKSGLSDRCELIGYVKDKQLLGYLSSARAIFYAPYDEDYGYATIEAFLAQKLVITTYDSGEVKMFVEETGSGIVSDTKANSIAESLSYIYDLKSKELKEMALSGYYLSKNITWENVLKKLVLNNLSLP
jgi:glycosyltransferase involved in cell wall biosynthesis